MDGLSATHMVVDGFLTNNIVFTKSSAESLLSELAAVVGHPTKDLTILSLTTSKSHTISVCLMPFGHLLLHHIAQEKAISLDVFKLETIDVESVINAVSTRLSLRVANLSVITRAYPPGASKMSSESLMSLDQQKAKMN